MSAVPMQPLTPIEAYRMRWKRRRLLWRALRARHGLKSVVDRTGLIKANDILAVVVQRNEALRLPHFMDYYRGLGVAHFLFVDNGSEDGSRAFLEAQPDVSLWQTKASYRDARFGVDWLTWLQIRHAHGHWCLTVDPDELLVYDGCGRHDLRDLVALLDRRGAAAFGALMLDLYPDGPLGAQSYDAGQDPLEVLTLYDDGPHTAQRQRPMGNLWVRGGPRARVFFADAPSQAPTMNKLPLVRWNRRFVYANSTHAILPPHLNGLFDGPGDRRPCGVLLHTKFLPEIVSRSATEKARGQHFHTPEAFEAYYDRVGAGPDLRWSGSRRWAGVQGLVDAGLASPLDWP